MEIDSDNKIIIIDYESQRDGLNTYYSPSNAEYNLSEIRQIVDTFS